jgi:hypothetical protein
MSADNYLSIRKKDDEWIVYEGCESTEIETKRVTCDTRRRAVEEANAILASKTVQYGIIFIQDDVISSLDEKITNIVVDVMTGHNWDYLYKAIHELVKDNTEERTFTVNRFEIIDHCEGSHNFGRTVIKRSVKDFRVQESVQDDGRTLKVFINE